MPKYIGSILNNKQSRYERLYEVVRDANIIINNMPSTTSVEERNVMGTAYALRAIAYYQLLREYCEPFENEDQLGLSIIRDFDMEERPIRSSYGLTMRYIEDDFNKALSYNVDQEIYRFTHDVIKAYLARYYFWTKQWESAAQLSKEIIEKYPLVSGEAYVDMIQSANEAKGNVLLKSYLFSGDQDLAFISNAQSVRNRPISKEFADLFLEKDRDIRYELSINNKRINQKTMIGKVRSAEFQLILAECYAHLGQEDNALEAINTLRNLRIKNNQLYTSSNIPAVDRTTLIKMDANGKLLTPLIALILNERRKELYLEGDRFFELKRNGRPEFWAADNGLKYTTKSYMYTFPIPRIDIEIINGLVQNEGYKF